MKPVLKWTGVAALGLAGIVAAALAAVYGVSEYRFRKEYALEASAVALSSDPATLERGRHVATIRGCLDCHSETAGGRLFLDAPIGRLYASNLTRGNGGVGARYTDADWVAAIRHGIGPDRKPLLFMPSHEFYPLSDEDLGALISYLKSLPPVDNPQPPSSVGLLGRALFVAGQLPLVPAELIDHQGPRPKAPAAGVTVEYGAYLATSCIGCHGEGFSGGPVPGTPPDFLPAANLTPHPETGLGAWTEEQFFTALREGKRPDGTEIRPPMPWQLTAQMTDDELRALWLYFRSLPPTPYGNR